MCAPRSEKCTVLLAILYYTPPPPARHRCARNTGTRILSPRNNAYPHSCTAEPLHTMATPYNAAQAWHCPSIRLLCNSMVTPRSPDEASCTIRNAPKCTPPNPDSTLRAIPSQRSTTNTHPPDWHRTSVKGQCGGGRRYIDGGHSRGSLKMGEIVG